MKLLFTFLLLSSVCLGQSKKDQIIALNTSIDSLNTVLATTRDNSTKEIGSLNDKIKEVSEEVTTLKSDLTNLQTSNNKLKTDLAELSKKNLELEAKLEVIESNKIEDGLDEFNITLKRTSIYEGDEVQIIGSGIDGNEYVFFFNKNMSDDKLLNDLEELNFLFYSNSENEHLKGMNLTIGFNKSDSEIGKRVWDDECDCEDYTTIVKRVIKSPN